MQDTIARYLSSDKLHLDVLILAVYFCAFVKAGDRQVDGSLFSNSFTAISAD